jgi:hypothetical protein
MLVYRIEHFGRQVHDRRYTAAGVLELQSGPLVRKQGMNQAQAATVFGSSAKIRDAGVRYHVVRDFYDEAFRRP